MLLVNLRLSSLKELSYCLECVVNFTKFVLMSIMRSRLQNEAMKTEKIEITQIIASFLGFCDFPGFVHLYGIQVTEFIVRYQINHSPHDNEIGYLGNIEIVAFCIGDPLRRVIPYIGVYKLELMRLRVVQRS